MKSTDICFYMSITKEENSSFTFEANNMLNEEEISLTGQLTRKLSFRRVSSIKLANNSAVFIEKSKSISYFIEKKYFYDKTSNIRL